MRINGTAAAEKILRKAKYYVISAKYAGFHTNFSGKPHDLPRNMRLYSNHDRKAAITEPLLLFSLKPGFPAGLSLFPRPSIAASHFTKTRVEIAVLDNSPCQIAVFGPQNGDLTRGIADFGYFNPYCGAPAHASRQGIAIGAVCLARPPRTSASEPLPPLICRKTIAFSQRHRYIKNIESLHPKKRRTQP